MHLKNVEVILRIESVLLVELIEMGNVRAITTLLLLCFVFVASVSVTAKSNCQDQKWRLDKI